jgi:hypothetical protein
MSNGADDELLFFISPLEWVVVGFTFGRWKSQAFAPNLQATLHAAMEGLGWKGKFEGWRNAFDVC